MPGRQQSWRRGKVLYCVICYSEIVLLLSLPLAIASGHGTLAFVPFHESLGSRPLDSFFVFFTYLPDLPQILSDIRAESKRERAETKLAIDKLQLSLGTGN